MNIIDIVLDDSNLTGTDFVGAERSDTHDSIPLAASTVETDINYRRVHIGLADIIAHAPVVPTYEELPENGIVALVRKNGTVGNIVTFQKLGDAQLYQWLFNNDPFTSDHDVVHLLHDGALALPTATPSTEEES